MGFGNNDYANNYPQVLERSLFEYGHTEYTGANLSHLENDAYVKQTNDDIFQYTQRTYGSKNVDYWYHTANDPASRTWDTNSDNYIAFGGRSKILGYLEAGSWLDRSAHFTAHVVGSTEGTLTVSYTVNDTFDLRPESYKAWYYNLVAKEVGFYYHDVLGGNDQMTTTARWISVLHTEGEK